ncbi:MAG: tetratricopeptide repeat protein [Vampirovibrionales bacterium]|nr:tetratricopeptide repeat protein [Vampirovibrionales bacterium]
MMYRTLVLTLALTGLLAVMPILPASALTAQSLALPETSAPGHAQSQLGTLNLILAEELASQGQVLASIPLFEQATLHLDDADAQKPFAYLELGLAYSALDRFVPAAGAYQSALKLNPVAKTASELHWRLGLALNDLGQTQNALAELMQASRLDPKNPGIWADMGVLHANEKQFAASAKMSQQAITLLEASESLSLSKPEALAEVLNNYGYALAKSGQPADGLSAIERSLALRPASAATLDSQGYALAQLGRHAEAVTAYEKALKIEPTMAEGWLHQAQSLEALGNLKEAHSAYERFLSLSEKAPASVLEDRALAQAKLLEIKRQL